MATPLRAVALAATMLLSVTLVAPQASAIDATFNPTASNEWWVQVSVGASGALAGVDARVDGGSWKALSLRSYGWATSMHAPSGSVVQFRARGADGTSDLSGCYQWTTRAPIACPGGTTSTSTTTTTSTASSPFTPKSGSEWWVQVRVAGSPTKVEARDTDGAWTALSLRSWGDWAASFHVERGHQVQYRATFAGGSTQTSCWYVHPGSTCASTSTSTGTTTPTTTPAPTSGSGSSALWQDSFASSPWSAPWKLVSSWGTSRMDVLRESSTRAPTYLRAEYPSGTKGGGEFKGTLGLSPREELHMRYDVRFPVGFDFVRGGKLPGLYGGTGPSGGNIPDGTDGWSTRLMWRTGGAGEVYAYLPTSEEWGTSLGRGSWSFSADGKWHRVEQKVTLNTPGYSNGEVKVWYDGVQVLHKTGLKFRTTSTLKVNGIFFSTFFGGNDASWYPSKTLHADFANFAVGTSYIG